MPTVTSIKKLFNAASPGLGNECDVSPNESGGTLEVQVYSMDGATGVGVFEGKIFPDAPFIKIGAFNYQTNDMVPDISNSIFSLPLSSFCQIRVNMTSVTGGTLIITGKGVA